MSTNFLNKVEKLEKKRAALMSSIDKLKKAALVKGKKETVLDLVFNGHS